MSIWQLGIIQKEVGHVDEIFTTKNISLKVKYNGSCHFSSINRARYRSSRSLGNLLGLPSELD